MEGDLTDDEREQYAEEFEQLDAKVILVQILTELQRLNATLSDDTRDAESDATTYRCVECQTTVPADARARHARETHKAPEGMADRLFEEVEG